MSLLLYIHGFLSSPLSAKAVQCEAWLKQHRPDIQYCCPALTAYPKQVMEQLESIVESHQSESIYLLGSSMGGFYATVLAEKHGFPAVLINPAVNPHQLISNYLHTGLKNYHNEERYRLDESDTAALEALNPQVINCKSRIWLMAQTGDETLNYRDAVEKYCGCKQLIEEGGDHSFQNFQQHLPDIIEFFEKH
ncbi:YqiA/YcfP family alpha/beta fold hydrolase [Aurantivibrio plasticivorans]